MKMLVMETARMLALIAAITGGLLFQGPGLSVFMEEGRREPYLLERQRAGLEREIRKQPDSLGLIAELAATCEQLGLYHETMRLQERMIGLAPQSAARLREHAATVATLRKDAARYFHCDAQQVPEIALRLYAAAVVLAPKDASLARESAMAFYQFSHNRQQEAIDAWRHVLHVAPDANSRAEAHVHLARWLGRTGKIGAARRHLAMADGFDKPALIEATYDYLDQEIRDPESSYSQRRLAKKRSARARLGRTI